MKNRVKVLASALLLLGFISLSTETSNAAARCYNVVTPDVNGKLIWRCVPGPEGCINFKASTYEDDMICSIPN